MSKKFTLGKQERLKSRKAIETLFSSGRSLQVVPLRFVYLITGEKEMQFASGVSSKNFRKAVDRNRIKRLIRESYRLEKPPLREKLFSMQKGLHVFVSYAGKELPDYDTIHAAMIRGLGKLEKMINENSTTHT